MIKNFNLFKESIDEESKIHKICKKYKIKNYTINDDLSIDVDSYVNLDNKKLYELPLKFRKVRQLFTCDNNNLTSLFGCPQWVGGEFSCVENNITSLEFCPRYVGRDFFCYDNKISSLEHFPDYIGDINNGYMNLCNNKIWSFKDIPDNFKRDIHLDDNPIFNIWKLFLSSKDIEFFNECDIIREPETPDGLPIVVLERLNYFLDVIGRPTVEKVEGYINI
jgi:hypothetical protein